LTVDPESRKSQGDCRQPDLCPKPSIVLACDDDTDCPRGGTNGATPAICALSYVSVSGDPFIPASIAHSECRLASSDSLKDVYGLGLCEKHRGCADSAFPCKDSNSDLLPSYNWCRLDLATPISAE
jgi:hypothetical protein